MTYTELKQAIIDYLAMDEETFIDNIPLFVKAVENRIYNEAQIPALRKNVTGMMQSGNRYVVVPADFISVFSFALIEPAQLLDGSPNPSAGDYSYMLYKDVNLIREMYPAPNVLGKSKVFGLFNTTTLIIGPSPDKNYGIEMHYFYYPESMVTAGESWVSKNFPSVMLYGAVAEGYRFMKGEAAQQQVYDTQYREALNLLKKLGEGVQRDDAFSTTVLKPKIQIGE